MSDEEVIERFVDKGRGILIAARVKPRFVEKDAEMAEYLRSRYQEEFRGYAEVISRIYHKIDEVPRCKVCGGLKPFMGFKQPYTSTSWCSPSCQLSDKDFIESRNSRMDMAAIKEKRQKTMLEKYGDPHYRNLEKARKTMLECYGTECGFSGPIRERTKERLFAEYGKYSITNPQKIRQTKLERYGDGAYVNKEKARRTMVERYGAEYTLQSDVLRKKVAATKEERYGDKNYVNAEKARQTLMDRYGVENPFQLKEVRDKIDYGKALNTKSRNHTFNSSMQEDRMYEILCGMFGKDDVHRQYSDDRYPYAADFYIKSKDLFIELQGHYTHGQHGFDEGNEDDLKLKEEFLSKAKEKPSYAKTIEVWCGSDVEKRKVAKRNGVRLLEIFGVRFDENTLKRDINKILLEG